MADKTVDLWALDEVHFHQQGSRCRMWIPPETKDPIVYHHPTRKSVGYFAAVRLRDPGSFLFRREIGKIQRRDLLGVPKKCSGKSAPSLAAAAFWPSATTHSITAPNCIWSGATSLAPQFGLDFLPPYSPDLNPIERVWKLTRRLCLHNRYFGFLDGVVAAVEDQFAEWITPNDSLRRLCAIT